MLALGVGSFLILFLVGAVLPFVAAAAPFLVPLLNDIPDAFWNAGFLVLLSCMVISIIGSSLGLVLIYLSYVFGTEQRLTEQRQIDSSTPSVERKADELNDGES